VMKINLYFLSMKIRGNQNIHLNIALHTVNGRAVADMTWLLRVLAVGY
jgi:hypothetical protein